jgi:hypothetical protein
MLRWYRELIAKKFDGLRFRKSVGRPSVDEEIERLLGSEAHAPETEAIGGAER